MITPEPPAGSEHYREGWRHGYEQAAIDRERSADAVRLVPETAAVAGGDPADVDWNRANGELRTVQKAILLLHNRSMAADIPRRLRLRAAEAALAVLAGPAPDTGQARETGADWAARPRRFSPADTLSVAERLGAAEPSGGTVHPTAEPSDAWVIGRFTDATAQHGDRTFEMWDDDVHRTSAAALHHHVTHVEDPDPWSWHIYALVRIAYAGSSADTVQTPDAPDLAYARSEVDKWLDDGDPYCILPTRTEHIPALLARLDELEATR